MKRLGIVMAAVAVLLCGCGAGDDKKGQEEEAAVYMQITAKEAKAMMEEQEEMQ